MTEQRKGQSFFSQRSNLPVNTVTSRRSSLSPPTSQKLTKHWIEGRNRAHAPLRDIHKTFTNVITDTCTELDVDEYKIIELQIAGKRTGRLMRCLTWHITLPQIYAVIISSRSVCVCYMSLLLCNLIFMTFLWREIHVKYWIPKLS